MGWEYWILFRLLISAALAAVIGYERQRSGKAAGLRTHMLVAVGSTLFASLNDLYAEAARKTGVPVELSPTRAVQAIAMGIGFLGGGTIFVSHGEHRVKGLTTAASIWVTAAMGMVVALDCYILAAGTTVIIWGILQLLERMESPGSNGHAHPPIIPEASRSAPE